MIEISYAAHTVLPDGSPLLAVAETRRVRRWLRSFEVSETVSYVLKGGSWWGRDGAVPKSDPKHMRLCEIAMQQQIRRSVDAAIELELPPSP